MVWGKVDDIIAPPSADEFVRDIALARVAMMDGAGHMPDFEQAGNVAKLVGEFSRHLRIPEGFLPIGASRLAAALCATAGSND